MNKKIQLLSAICLMLAFSIQAQTVDKRFNGLDTSFARVLKDWKAAGFAVAVVEKNKIVYSKGFGYRDLEKKLPVTPNTLFAIGSCTKAFTSSIIGILQKDGKLDIDKPIRNFLPELRFYNNDMDNQITTRDLMCHRTGLPRHDLAWYLFPSTRDSLLQRIRYQAPTAGIREIYQYNNFMFLAQGVLAEKLSGKKWEALVKEYFFTPLGMNSSNFSVTDLEKSSDASLGYYVKKDSIIEKLPYYNIDALGPAGSINSSVTEMANWAITWINGGKFNGKEIIPAAHVTAAISSQMVSGAALPDKENPDIHLGNYGFAWGINSYRGHYRVQHGGNIDGFSALVSFYPSDSIGIIVLTNQNGSSVPGVVRNIISDRLLKLSPVDWSGTLLKTFQKNQKAAADAQKSAQSRKKSGTTTSHALKEFEGVYANPGYGSIETTFTRDSLFGQIPNKKLWFKHYHYNVFEIFEVDPLKGIDTSDNLGILFQFNANVNGEIDNLSADLQPGVDPIIFKRSPKVAPVKKEELQKYVGDYDLPGAVVKVYIKNENVLYVMVPGQPEYETVPVGKHEFKLKVLTGYSVKFEVNDKNEVLSVSFIQPNGIFKAKRK